MDRSNPSDRRTGGGERSGPEHPSPRRLAAYHEKRLGDADAEAVREHLVGCRECLALLLELDALPEVDPARPVRDARLAAEARAIRDRAGAESGEEEEG